MADLIYFAIASLDGYIADRDGNFGWAQPDAEVHQLANDLLRPVGTYLYGRRMYETMAAWETEPELARGSDITEDFARVWQAADKVVYSTTLDAPLTSRTRVERAFDPDAVRRMKEEAQADLSIGGPGLAAHAIDAGLVDEYHLVLAPVVVGGGTAFLPSSGRIDLELRDERRFAGGFAYLHYAARTRTSAA